ncbi:hypothetical protein HYS85_01975, partial [Candidatus Saccharibacteria bacterium]|nr:hypothetical protein [Candidatus Saccharibacteria bacterium]
VKVVPGEQQILAEFDDVVVGTRRGVTVGVELNGNPGQPIWKKFIAERTVDSDLPIPFYERRIKRAKRKAAKIAAAMAIKNY